MADVKGRGHRRPRPFCEYGKTTGYFFFGFGSA